MAGSTTDVDRGYTKSSTINLFLFGKTGNGKSPIGNGILGRNEILLIPSMFGVTSNSGLQSTKLKDGRFLNVIDVFGLFGSDETEPSVKEIVRFLSLAKDGIHAILMFFSDRSRITPDEEDLIEHLKTFFGDKILNYMIVVLPGENVLKSSGVSHEKFVRHKMHRSLKKFIQSSNGRVLFDKKTCDEKKQAEQLESLMNLVDTVVANNYGKPFSDDIFGELKEIGLLLEHIETEVESMGGFTVQQISALKEEINQLYQISENLETVEQKLKQFVEKQLVERQAAWLVAEKFSVEAKKKSDEDLHKLIEILKLPRSDSTEICGIM